MKTRIGVFDSGIGGITVLSELRRSFGFADYIYLGDTAHVPYGTKSPSQILKLSIDCAQLLREKKVDALVVACNTVSSWAIEAIAEMMKPIPVFEVIKPGVEAALHSLNALNSAHPHGLTSTDQIPVLVLATRATIRSRAYGKALRHGIGLGGGHGVVGESVPIFEQACPLLVPMIEEGWIDHPVLHETILEYVRCYTSEFPRGVALLGCTHYPWIHQAFENALPGWVVVNSARAIADSLEKAGFFPSGERGDPLGGKIEWVFTDPEVVPDFATKWIKGLGQISSPPS